MIHTQKEEIGRWVNSPEGTGVWINKQHGNGWFLHSDKSMNCWYPEFLYVVDDEWAELRKAQIDGKQLQLNPTFSKNGVWMDKKLTDDRMSFDTPKQWRIKHDEPVYEWQVILKRDNDSFWMSNDWYTEEEAVKHFKNSYIVKMYEPSKRIRK